MAERRVIPILPDVQIPGDSQPDSGVLPERVIKVVPMDGLDKFRAKLAEGFGLEDLDENAEMLADDYRLKTVGGSRTPHPVNNPDVIAKREAMHAPMGRTEYDAGIDIDRSTLGRLDSKLAEVNRAIGERIFTGSGLIELQDKAARLNQGISGVRKGLQEKWTEREKLYAPERARRDEEFQKALLASARMAVVESAVGSDLEGYWAGGAPKGSDGSAADGSDLPRRRGAGSPATDEWPGPPRDPDEVRATVRGGRGQSEEVHPAGEEPGDEPVSAKTAPDLKKARVTNVPPELAKLDITDPEYVSRWRKYVSAPQGYEDRVRGYSDDYHLNMSDEEIENEARRQFDRDHKLSFGRKILNSVNRKLNRPDHVVSKWTEPYWAVQYDNEMLAVQARAKAKAAAAAGRPEDNLEQFKPKHPSNARVMAGRANNIVDTVLSLGPAKLAWREIKAGYKYDPQKDTVAKFRENWADRQTESSRAFELGAWLHQFRRNQQAASEAEGHDRAGNELPAKSDDDERLSIGVGKVQGPKPQ